MPSTKKIFAGLLPLSGAAILLASACGGEMGPLPGGQSRGQPGTQPPGSGDPGTMMGTGMPPSGPTGPNDAFGLKMIYPSNPAGSQWSMPADPKNDPRIQKGGYVPNFAANADGSFKVTMTEVRWDVEQQNGFKESTLVLDQGMLPARGFMQDAMDWKNVEVTAYYRLNQHSTSTQNGEAHIEHVMGGARQTSETTNLNGFPRACEADSYHANLYPLTGRTKYERDLMHTNGYSTNDPQKSNATMPFVDSKTWVGWKTVKYVQADGKSVKLESYIDRQGNNDWVKIFEYVDDGKWGPTRGHIGSTCGGGEYTVVTWGGPLIGLRWDNITDLDAKWASVREIIPPDRGMTP